ncbi:uncharacterized protein LOC108252005 [Diaphorina citri]|uniref:Uncharacterized protein LOC108252005 n=1 Tax=Diaphorina citri TaxID=121845 RepID=A0A1S4E7Q4_DIACI|nr:uncharacterized protein LOC108252005 [Diaphorina citri]
MLAVCYKNNKCTLYNTGVPLSYSPRMEGYDSTPVLECKSCERYGTEQYLKLYNCFCQDRICVNQTTRWNCLICKDPEKKFNSIISVFNHWCNKHKHSHDEHGMLFQCTLCQPSKRTGFPLHSLMEHVIGSHFTMAKCKLCSELFINVPAIVNHLTFDHDINKSHSVHIDDHVLRIDFVHYLQRFTLSPNHSLRNYCLKVT